MALDFPSSPATNSTYSYGGKTWKYSGTVWALQNAAAAPTAAALLASILTVDGTGSGLDADLVDGLNTSSTDTTGNSVVTRTTGGFSTGNITIANRAYVQAQTLTDAATIAWNTATAQIATVTLGGNRIMGAPTNLVNGAFYSLQIIQDATGSRTLAWNTVFKWVNASPPVLSISAAAKDFIVFRSDGTNLYEQGRSLGVA